MQQDTHKTINRRGFIVRHTDGRRGMVTQADYERSVGSGKLLVYWEERPMIFSKTGTQVSVADVRICGYVD